MTPAKAEKQIHPLVKLQQQFTERSGELKNALPSTISPERFIRGLLTAVQRNPDLLACERQSLWNACLAAASDGLLPDGREGAIVAFKDKAQWMPMVGGLLKRFRNSGQFKSISVGIVRDGDQFEHWIDENGEHMKHFPGDDGKPVKAYAVAVLANGGTMVKVMTEAEINKRRNASRAKNSQLWTEWTEEAWIKTVLRNLAKRLPMSSDLDDLIRREDELYDFRPNNPEPPAGKQITDIGERLDAFGGEKKDPQAGAELAEELDLETGEVKDA